MYIIMLKAPLLVLFLLAFFWRQFPIVLLRLKVVLKWCDATKVYLLDESRKKR